MSQIAIGHLHHWVPAEEVLERQGLLGEEEPPRRRWTRASAEGARDGKWSTHRAPLPPSREL
eukprot:12196221-Alexandrium_andersonii.AAC.1